MCFHPTTCKKFVFKRGKIGISTLIMLVSNFLNNVIKENFLHYRHVTDYHQHVDFDYVGLLKNKFNVV